MFRSDDEKTQYNWPQIIAGALAGVAISTAFFTMTDQGSAWVVDKGLKRAAKKAKDGKPESITKVLMANGINPPSGGEPPEDEGAPAASARKVLTSRAGRRLLAYTSN